MLEQSSFLSTMVETWRPVIGYEGRYEVSDHGRVRSLRFFNRSVDRRRKTPLLMRLTIGKSGYLQVSLGHSVTRTVHGLVLEAFVGPRPVGYEASHLNGQRPDNRLVNLRWETHAENDARRVDHGTLATGTRTGAYTKPERLPRGDRHGSYLHPESRPRGEQNAMAKLTVTQVIEIRAAAIRGEIHRTIAARYGVHRSLITAIVARRWWRHVE